MKGEKNENFVFLPKIAILLLLVKICKKLWQLCSRNFVFCVTLVVFACSLISAKLCAFESRDISIEFGTTNLKWVDIAKEDRVKIKMLLTYLLKSTTGKDVVAAAAKKASSNGYRLSEIITPNEISYTDTSLVRKFSKDGPEKVFFEENSKIYLNRNYTVREALMDLAHELTHYSYRKRFNPYLESFTALSFLKSCIEGPGGEVDAYIVECNVLKELFPRDIERYPNCQKLGESAVFNGVSKREVDRQQVIDLFYRVGDDVDLLISKYKEEILGKGKRYDLLREQTVSELKAKLIDQNVKFISSVYSVSYPEAILSEYKNITKNVCENELKRMQLFDEKFIKSEEFSRRPSSTGERSIASINFSLARDALRKKVRTCSQILNK